VGECSSLVLCVDDGGEGVGGDAGGVGDGDGLE